MHDNKKTVIAAEDKYEILVFAWLEYMEGVAISERRIDRRISPMERRFTEAVFYFSAHSNFMSVLNDLYDRDISSDGSLLWEGYKKLTLFGLLTFTENMERPADDSVWIRYRNASGNPAPRFAALEGKDWGSKHKEYCSMGRIDSTLSEDKGTI